MALKRSGGKAKSGALEVWELPPDENAFRRAKLPENSGPKRFRDGKRAAKHFSDRHFVQKKR
jgi:hypothetical protein